jgi:hypothetical protein
VRAYQILIGTQGIAEPELIHRPQLAVTDGTGLWLPVEVRERRSGRGTQRRNQKGDRKEWKR